MNANDESKTKISLANIHPPIKPHHVPLQLDFNSLSTVSPAPRAINTATSTSIITQHHNASNLPPPPLSAGAESSTSTNSVRTPTPTAAQEPTTPNTDGNTSSTANATSSSSTKEKRKRSRVTPEQLAQLERIFVLDKSPTAQRRKEISDMLGMQERQTQIWFQNRRAKAKLQEVKRNSLAGYPKTSSSPPLTPHTPVTPHTPHTPHTAPVINSSLDSELVRLLHEEDVTIIPCAELSIGSWRRIASDPPSSSYGSRDLIAYFSTFRRCINWYIHSDGFGFKMEIPFDIITNAEFSDAPSNGAAQALATFYLSRPPNFYLEQPSVTPPPITKGSISIGGYVPGGSTEKMWKRCADWTEGMQASSVLRHDLIGNAAQVMQAIYALRDGVQPQSAAMPHIPLLNPQVLSYVGRQDSTVRPMMRMPTATLQQPSLSGTPTGPSSSTDGREPAEYGYVESNEIHHLPARHRNFTPTSSFSESFSGSQQQLPQEQHVSYASSPTAYATPHHPGASYGYEPVSPSYTTPPHHTQSSLSDYSTVPISQAANSQHRGTPVSHPLPETPPNATLSHHEQQYTTHYRDSASPPLLTTPFSPEDGVNSNGHDSGSSNADIYATNHNGQDEIGMGYGMNQ